MDNSSNDDLTILVKDHVDWAEIVSTIFPTIYYCGRLTDGP